VTSQDDWEAAVAAAVPEFGGLDILVNNAGIVDLAGIEDTSLADWRRTIEIGQTGVFLGMKTAAAALAASGHGSVISISSVFGASGGCGTSPAYHAAKGAVRTLTKNIALHWADRGVRVNSVHPGFIDTPILDPVRGTPAEHAMTGLTPLGRLGQPAEVAAGVAYLASEPLPQVGHRALVKSSTERIDSQYVTHPAIMPAAPHRTALFRSALDGQATGRDERA
jgi:NAD(P)-dependent dehydrogenase (short-subunit alcohol dehydrogenase family)